MKRTRPPQKLKTVSAAELSGKLHGREVSPGQFMALCPAHNDTNPSLAISERKGSIVFHCFAGCNYKSISQALKRQGISLSGNRKVGKGQGLPKGIESEWRGKKFAAIYKYKNENGEIIGYVVRYESKTGEKEVIPYFKKEEDHWKTGYKYKDNRPLYNLDKIATTPEEETIYIVEGEKCCDALEALDITATTSPGGSNAPSKADWSPISGHNIVIWPDNDRAGATYAANIIRQIHRSSDSKPNINIIDVKNLGIPEKGDVIDWLEQGNREKDILSLPLSNAQKIEDVGVIEYNPAEPYKAVDQAEQFLLARTPYVIFQRHSTIVRIFKSDRDVHLQQVTPPFYLDLLNRTMTFVQENSKKEFKSIDPPGKIAQRYLSRVGHWKLHCLTGLIHAPTLRPDGTILEREGYDEETGIYYDAAGTCFSPLDKNPTKDDAIRALKMLSTVFQDFPFVSNADESVIYAAILTGLIRLNLSRAPLFAINAPIAGSGKTLIANLISIITTGRIAAPCPIGGDREEERKSLFSKLLQGRPVLLIDNIEKPIKSDILANILTAPGKYSDRILGHSEIVEVPTQVTFLATGNNLVFQGDMTRRVLMCTIDPKCERPDAREGFKFKNIEKHVHRHRDQFVKAGLTILKAYIVAEKPKQDLAPYGSFEEWSDLVRSALTWIDCEDPNQTRERIEAEDTDKLNLGRILKLWKILYDVGERIKAFEIIDDCNDAIEKKRTGSKKYEMAQLLLEVTRSRSKQLSARAIGNYLRSNKGKIIDGYKIENISKNNRYEWILKKV